MVIADTHAVLWWVGGSEQLPDRTRAILDRGPLAISVVTCMEIVFLARRKRLDLTLEPAAWIDALQSLPGVTLLPVTVEIATTAGMLPEVVRDPCDRLITATAIVNGLPLVTKDHQIIAANLVPTIW